MRAQFWDIISSYEVYRTGKPCNIVWICTPMVYIPANTAELSCPLQVIQRHFTFPELHFIVFATPCPNSHFCRFLLIQRICPELCPTGFFPLLQAYPVRQGAYAFPVRALWLPEAAIEAQGGGYCKTLCDLKRT